MRVGFPIVALGYLALVLLLGGASAAGFPANLLLQVLGAAMIGYCLWRPDPGAELERIPWRALGAALAALVVIQMLPLPPALWVHLPGRGAVAEGFRLLGEPLPWLSISLNPWATVASLAWWIPAVAVFMAMSRNDAPRPQHIARLLVVAAALSVALSAMQRAGRLYFYEVTNYGLGTGFFANSNHQASFLLIALALWGAHQATSSVRIVPADRRQTENALFLGVVLLLVVGVLLSNSLAGVGLLLPVLAGVALLSLGERKLPTKAVLAAGGLLIVLVAAFAVFGWREASGPAGATSQGHTRFDYLVNGSKVLVAAFPIGWGLGTFREVYQWFEPPASIGTSYVNHAHNDLAELLIETGVVGLVPLLMFLAWWARRAIVAVRDRRRAPYALAGALATGAVLAHSLVDYPLRTAAISSLFALGCVLMLGRERQVAARERGGREAEVVKLVI